jgi:hypothetical protein
MEWYNLTKGDRMDKKKIKRIITREILICLIVSLFGLLLGVYGKRLVETDGAIQQFYIGALLEFISPALPIILYIAYLFIRFIIWVIKH